MSDDLLWWFVQMLEVEGWKALPCQPCGREGRLSVHVLHQRIQALADRLEACERELAVIRPPAQNYNRTLARAEQAEAELDEARALLAGAAIPLEALWAAECEQARGLALGMGSLGLPLQHAIGESVEAIRAFLARTEAK